MSMLDYAKIKSLYVNNKEYLLYKTVGYARSHQFEFCQFITLNNLNCKTIVVATLHSLSDILPDCLQYNSLYKDSRYFETDYLGFHVTSDPELFDNILKIVKPLYANGLFFISLNEKDDIMKHIGYIQFC